MPDKSILNKIKAFLKMAESPYEAEAKTAMEKVHQLLIEHNLSMGDINTEEELIKEGIYFTANRLRPWKATLFYAVIHTFMCDSMRIKSPFYVENHGTKQWSTQRKKTLFEYRIIGREDSIIMAQMMLDYLIEVIERMSKNIERNSKESYKNGIVDRLCERLVEMQKKDNTECYALVKNEKAMTDNFVQQHYPERTKFSHSMYGIKDDSAYAKGRNDGSGISLNSQLREDRNNSHLLGKA